MKKQLLISTVGFFMTLAALGQNKFNTDTTYRNNLSKETRISKFSIDPKRQTPDFIFFREGQGFSLAESRNIFENFLPMRNGIDELTIVSATKSYGNIETVKYQQFFNGIKVEHGALGITAKDGKINSVITEFYALDAATKIIPDISEEQAFVKATQFVSAQKYDWQQIIGGTRPQGELVLVEDFFTTKGMRLAYKFDIYAVQPLSRAYVYIDAADGTPLLNDRLIKHTNPDLSDNPVNASTHATPNTDPTALNTGISTLATKKKVNNGGKPFANATGTAVTRYSGTQTIITDNGVPTFHLAQLRNGDNITVKNYQRRNQSGANNLLAVDFVDVDNNWTAAEWDNATWDNAAFDVQFAMQFISDYWQTVHTRNSWDNGGAAMNSYVHVRSGGLDYDNAFWLSGTNAMFYGDGTYLGGNAGGFLPLTSLDVSAHELGHAVCQSTANLTYARESGAMNEGFSDIWGASIEHFSGLPAPKDPWLIGEEILPSAAALRSMSNPKSQGQPDTYLGTYWVDATVGGCPTPSQTTNDYCGVHTNSGVLNHWYYILVMGKSGVNDVGNGYNVTGVGWTDGERIAYLTELNLVGQPNATYANARTASIAASTTLFGACSPQTIATTNAWYAVNVGTQFAPCGVEVYYKNAVVNVTEFTAPVACPGSSRVITATITLQNIATQTTDATITVVPFPSTTATSGQDFTISPATVTWTAGQTGDRTFNITINDDQNFEGNETLVIGYTLNNHSGNAVAGSFNQTATINIIDDERVPTDDILTNGVGTSAGFISISFSAGSNLKKRVQHLYTAAELTAAGFTKGNINRLGFYFYNNPSSVAFSNFNLKIGNTAAVQLNAGFVAYSGPTVTIFSGTFNSPIGTGWVYFNMPNPTFYWDGVSNIIIETCYDNASAATNVNLLVADRGLTNYHCTFVQSNVSNVCATAAASIIQYQPLLYLRIGDPIQSTTNLSKTAYLGPNADVPFFSTTDGKIMARIKNNTSFDYGCTQVLVDRTGNGSSQFWDANSAHYLTNKTFRVIPTTNNPAGNYDITLYYTKAEHDGWEAATGKDWETVGRVVKVTGHDINEVTPATTSYFSMVNVSLSPTRALFGTDYQITSNFFTGFSGFAVGDPGSNPLPIQLLSFTGAKGNNRSMLNWVTSFEQNNDRFEIETSKDGINYYKIGVVRSKGNSTIDQHYDFTDNLPAGGSNYYRLKQVDINGQVTYSNVVLLVFNNTGILVSLYPNPVNDKLTFAVSKPAAQVVFRIYTVDGKQVYTETANSIVRTHTIPVQQLPAGTYILESTVDGEKQLSRFIKQ